MSVLAFDTETALIAAGRLAPPMACLTWATLSDSGIDNPDEGVERIRIALRDPNTLIVGANVAFDFGVLLQHDPTLAKDIFRAYDENRVACTQTLAKLQYIAGVINTPAYSLAALAKHFLGATVGGKDAPDSWRFHYRKLIGVDVSEWPQRARDYAIKDAELTLDVWHVQSQQMVPDLFNQCRAAWAMHLMGCWGVRVDPNAVKALEERIRPPVEAIREELTLKGFYRADGTLDQKFLKKRVSQAYGDNPPRTEPTEKMLQKGATQGNIKTSEDVLKESNDADLMLLASMSADQKELSSFLPMFLEAVETGRPICPQWNVLVNSGRASCRNPSLMNLPRRAGVRDCFIPRDGNIFFGADYTAAEMATLAEALYQQIGPNSLQKALISGQQIHLLMAAKLLRRPYEDVVAAYAAGDKEVKRMRQFAKVANFGFPGGLSPRTLVSYAKAMMDLDISEEEAYNLQQEWLELFPEMRGYFRRVSDKVRHGLATFEQIWSKRLRAKTGYTAGCNTYFQGLVADGAKRALYEIAKAQFTDPTSPLWGSRLAIFVHDEIIAEGPVDRAAEAAEELARIMVREMSVVAPNVPHAAEPYLMSRWIKDTASIRDDSGKLLDCVVEGR